MRELLEQVHDLINSYREQNGFFPDFIVLGMLEWLQIEAEQGKVINFKMWGIPVQRDVTQYSFVGCGRTKAWQ